MVFVVLFVILILKMSFSQNRTRGIYRARALDLSRATRDLLDRGLLTTQKFYGDAAPPIRERRRKGRRTIRIASEREESAAREAQ